MLVIKDLSLIQMGLGLVLLIIQMVLLAMLRLIFMAVSQTFSVSETWS
jgi:hypothetical protein